MKKIVEKCFLGAGIVATVSIFALNLEWAYSGYGIKSTMNLHSQVLAQYPFCDYEYDLYQNAVSSFQMHCGGTPDIENCDQYPTNAPGCRSMCQSAKHYHTLWKNCQNSNNGGGDPGSSSSGGGMQDYQTPYEVQCTIVVVENGVYIYVPGWQQICESGGTVFCSSISCSP